jgi:hypothetical protein
MALRAVSLLALAAVLMALAAPAGAPAQSGPSAPSLGAPEPEETAPAPVTTDDPADDGLDTWQQVLIFAAGVVLLAGIAAAIISDARRRAPRRGRGDGRGGAGDPLDGRPAEDRHRQRQAGKQHARRKGRAARAARRRNR